MSQDATWHRGRPWSRTHCVRWGLSSPPQRGTAPSQFLAHICCGQTAGWIKMPLGRKVGRGPSDTVLDGNPAPPFQSGTTSPISGPCLLWPNSCMDQDASWYGGWRRPRPHCVRWEPSFPRKRGSTVLPQFLAHVCCGQMAGWIKVPLGMKAGLSPGHIVLHGDPAPLKMGTAPSIFGPCLLWPNNRPSQLLLSTCRNNTYHDRH